jgi:hypothetical protein
VSHPNAGIYCLTPAAGISPSDRPAVVSVDWDSTAPPEGNGVAMRVRGILYVGRGAKPPNPSEGWGVHVAAQREH